MLETPQERVRLLKAGIDGRTIERLYLIYNNIKVVRTPLLSDPGDAEDRLEPALLFLANGKYNKSYILTSGYQY